MKWNAIKLLVTSLVMLSVNGLAGGPAEPAHMPDVPMPAFNLFTPAPSDLALAHAHTHNLVAHHKVHHVSRTGHHKKHWVTLYPGSLETNVIRLSKSLGWQHIIWLPSADYHWIGKVRVAANNLPDILRQILSDYPLQADFYVGNHVLVIKPRTIQS